MSRVWGRDRFRFDDQQGAGTWFCNQCQPHAGDGFTLVQKVRHCTFPAAVRMVAGEVGLALLDARQQDASPSHEQKTDRAEARGRRRCTSLIAWLPT